MTSYKILIADDDDAIVRVLEYEFKTMGWNVHVCFDGLDAFNTAVEFIPDVLLADIKMPGMSGIELSKKLFEKFPDLLIILMTGNQELKNVIEVLRGPVYDFYEKPYKINHLVLNIEKGLKILRMNKKIGALENQINLLQNRLEDISGPINPLKNAMIGRSSTFQKIESRNKTTPSEMYKKHDNSFGKD